MDAAAGIPLPRSHRPNGAGQGGAKTFLVGGGIASLAAAAFMVDPHVLLRAFRALHDMRA